MDERILQLIGEYNCQSHDDYENALREIVQEVSLLGLWRAKFFEHALFYGGTALRILYNLPRFSEDLDFSLLKPNKKFDLHPYLNAIKEELQSFGFAIEVSTRDKGFESQILSAFVKAETKKHLLKINIPDTVTNKIPSRKLLKVKLEVDINPPGRHSTEAKNVYRPIPFQVKTMPPADLFAGKIHAVIARNWKTRVKGRDYYDYLWYIGRGTHVNLGHLKARLTQSGHFEESQALSLGVCKDLLRERFSLVDFEQAKKDIRPFIQPREQASIDLWDKEFFIGSLNTLKTQ